MVRFSHSDFDLLQRTILELHKLRDLETFRTRAPDLLLEAIPGDYFVWMESGFGPVETARQNVVFWDSPARSEPALLRRMMELLPEHPFTQHATRTGDWGPLRLSDFWSERRQLASPLNREVYRHVGIGRLLAIALFRGSRVGTLNVCRPLKAQDFSERDRQAMRLLAPHYEIALGTAEMLSLRGAGSADTRPTLGLTPRELEVGRWLSRTNSEIASILSMRPRTVEKHVENILQKLGCENRTAAAMIIGGGYPFGGGPAAGPQAAPNRATPAARFRAAGHALGRAFAPARTSRGRRRS